MAVSTAAAFKDALVDLLKADPNLGGAGVQVSYGFLARDVERETLAVGNIQWDTDEWAAVGHNRRNEIYGVSLYCWVVKPGGTQQEATERALALLGHVETLLQQDATVQLAGINWLSMEMVSVSESAHDEGYQAMAEATVTVRARK